MKMMKKYLIGVLLLGIAPLAPCQYRITPTPERKAPTERKAPNEKESTRVVAVVLPQDGGDFTVNKGDVIKYSRGVWGSVGKTYRVNYDESAFRREYENSNKGKQVKPGGDQGVGTTYLEALKEGEFVIEVVHMYRGETKKVVKYNITVK